MSRALDVGVGAQWAKPGGPPSIRRSTQPACSSTARGIGVAVGVRGTGRGLCARDTGLPSPWPEEETSEEARRERTGDVSSEVSVDMEGSRVRSSPCGLKSFVGTAEPDAGLWSSKAVVVGEAGTRAELRRMNFSAAAAAGVGSGSGEGALAGSSLRGSDGLRIGDGFARATTPGRLVAGLGRGVCGASSGAATGSDSPLRVLAALPGASTPASAVCSSGDSPPMSPAASPPASSPASTAAGSRPAVPASTPSSAPPLASWAVGNSTAAEGRKGAALALSLNWKGAASALKRKARCSPATCDGLAATAPGVRGTAPAPAETPNEAQWLVPGMRPAVASNPALGCHVGPGPACCCG
mmetsp:Transcript_18206/g.50286  ORF Transcript_18206/g.50286 Transcript_18206/m.50286 type:complete len:355 (-) Transcript_18206:298-1362(-)